MPECMVCHISVLVKIESDILDRRTCDYYFDS